MTLATDRAWQQFLDVLTGRVGSACCPTLDELQITPHLEETETMTPNLLGKTPIVPRHTKSCPACTGSVFCACDNTVLARHAWANHVTRAACQAYLRAGEAAYDHVITNAKAAES